MNSGVTQTQRLATNATVVGSILLKELINHVCVDILVKFYIRSSKERRS